MQRTEKPSATSKNRTRTGLRAWKEKSSELARLKPGPPIILSKEGQEQFVKALQRPPRPTPALRRLFRERTVLESKPRGLPKGPRRNQRNKHELPVAELLGAKLTSGSGAVNDDADMRVLGRWLVEHKARNSSVISISKKIFEKLRKQATKRGLKPALIVTSLTEQESVVVIDGNDRAYLSRPNSTLSEEKSRKQIHVDFPFFMNYWATVRSEISKQSWIPTICCWVSETPDSQPIEGRVGVKRFIIINIKDFKKYAVDNPPDKIV